LVLYVVEWTVTAAIAFGTIGLLVSAFFAFVRVRGGARRSWHLLFASPSYLDLSQYATKASKLSESFRRWGFFGLGCLAAAAIVRVLVP
jgi:bacteriorhodopsin